MKRLIVALSIAALLTPAVSFAQEPTREEQIERLETLISKLTLEVNRLLRAIEKATQKIEADAEENIEPQNIEPKQVEKVEEASKIPVIKHRIGGGRAVMPVAA